MVQKSHFTTARASTAIKGRRSRWTALSAVLLATVTFMPTPSGGSSTVTTPSSSLAVVQRSASESIVASNEPSGQAPPNSSQLPGFSPSYSTNFPGSSLPSGWSAFAGVPAGDPNSRWAPSHVVVGGGLLQLNAWQDPAYGNEWVTGGVSSSLAQTYGAYFVNSRITGPGPTQAELLWPMSGWPPEVDFDETYGDTTFSMATDHYTSANLQIHNTTYVDMTQWHTWGIIWTPTSMTYTVDGVVWGTVTGTGAVPNQPMRLNIQQQTYCALNYGCPTANASTQVDWVAEYALNPTSPPSSPPPPPSTTTTPPSSAPPPPSTTPTPPSSPQPPASTTPTPPSSGIAAKERIALRPFDRNSTRLSVLSMKQVHTLARRIVLARDSSVVLRGACATFVTSRAATITHARVIAVERYLDAELAKLGGERVVVTVPSMKMTRVSGAATSSRLRNCVRIVVVTIS